MNNEHEVHPLCSVNRPILFHRCLVKLFALEQHKKHYYYKVVYIFHSFVVITVHIICFCTIFAENFICNKYLKLR